MERKYMDYVLLSCIVILPVLLIIINNLKCVKEYVKEKEMEEIKKEKERWKEVNKRLKEEQEKKDKEDKENKVTNLSLSGDKYSVLEYIE